MSPRNPRRPRNLTFAVLLAILCAPIAWIGRADEETPAALYLELTLDGGKVDVRAMLRGAYAALQLEPPEELDDLDWRIDADSALGKARLESIRRRTDGLISATVEDDALKVRLQYAGHDETTDESRAAIESRLDRLVRALVLQRQPAYGVFFPRPHDVPLRPARYAEERETVPRRIVLLVHGLDDPGWLWDDVIEALRKEGHVVARLEYPNDGPIVDAADLLMQSLLELHALGVRRVDVVAHSMGGLVTRDVLTRPAYYGGDGEGDDAGPAIDRLIMCGTPNQGSSIARLRAVAGIGEQLSRLFSDRRRTMDLTGLADGAGEAAIDLSPGSAFLTQLNQRPRATHTEYTIVAGRISPVTEEQVREMGRELRETAAAAGAPSWLRDWLERAEDESDGLLAGAVRGLGDGCVTIDSARLAGVEDFTIVQANHVGLIVNLGASTTPAPAIPIILDRLGEADEPVDPSATD